MFPPPTPGMRIRVQMPDWANGMPRMFPPHMPGAAVDPRGPPMAPMFPPEWRIPLMAPMLPPEWVTWQMEDFHAMLGLQRDQPRQPDFQRQFAHQGGNGGPPMARMTWDDLFHGAMHRDQHVERAAGPRAGDEENRQVVDPRGLSQSDTESLDNDSDGSEF